MARTIARNEMDSELQAYSSSFERLDLDPLQLHYNRFINQPSNSTCSTDKMSSTSSKSQPNQFDQIIFELPWSLKTKLIEQMNKLSAFVHVHFNDNRIKQNLLESNQSLILSLISLKSKNNLNESAIELDNEDEIGQKLVLDLQWHLRERILDCLIAFQTYVVNDKDTEFETVEYYIIDEYKNIVKILLDLGVRHRRTEIESDKLEDEINTAEESKTSTKGLKEFKKSTEKTEESKSELENKIKDQMITELLKGFKELNDLKKKLRMEFKENEKHKLSKELNELDQKIEKLAKAHKMASPNEPEEEKMTDSTEESTKVSTKESTEEPTKESTDESTKVSTKESTKESTEESTKESPDESTKVSTKESTKESNEESTKESTKPLTKTTLRMEIENFDQFFTDAKEKNSELFYLNGLAFRIKCLPKCIKKPKPMLGIFLDGSAETRLSSGDYSIMVKAEMRLINKTKSEDKVRYIEHVFRKNEIDWGYREWVSESTLREKGFLDNGKIMVEIIAEAGLPQKHLEL